MTQVTFWVHDAENDTPHPAHMITACHLAMQACQNRQRCLVFCADQQQAEQFDELLWQQPLDRFVPHNLSGEGPANGAPVEITWQAPSQFSRPVLINLTEHTPEFGQRFKQIYDFVPAPEAQKQQARERYKHYRAAGYQLDTRPASSITESQDG